MNRYFIVCYVATVNGNQITCHSTITSKGTGFFKLSAFLKSILDLHPYQSGIVVTNIIELTQEEHEDYLS